MTTIRIPSRLAVALVLALTLPPAASAARAQQEATDADPVPAVVNCHDEARRAVTRVLASECAGAIVTDEQAKAIRGQRAQAIQRAIQGRERPVFADKRMVSVGTGFFVADGGRVVTNRHVVEKCDALTVETTTGSLASAKLVRFDDKLDIALIQANIATPATAVFQPRETIKPGGSVAVIGYPDQGLPPRKPLMTLGETVSLDRDRHSERIAIRAEVRPGNSGGPMLDQAGHVIGIVNAKVDTVKLYSLTKQLIRDVGFGISTAAILRFLDETGTPYRLNAVGTLLNAEQLFDRSRPFVVRVGCWR
jgi:S1-C subfamily serine protease